MNHLVEEQLIEHFYSSKDGADTPVSRHLESCAECAHAYAALQSDLAEVGKVEPPERDSAYGARVWQSIGPLLPNYERHMPSWVRGWWWRGLSYAAACALLVAGAFLAGRSWEHRQAQISAEIHSQQREKSVVHPQKDVVVVVLSDHLARTEGLLVELKHADAGSEELVSPLRDEARSLLAANRVCRQDAAQIGDPALAKALDHLEPLLAALANQRGELNSATIARLQKEMNRNGLLFEVRVLRSRMPDGQADSAKQPDGGTI
jgi:hypothetical protein